MKVWAFYKIFQVSLTYNMSDYSEVTNILIIF